MVPQLRAWHEKYRGAGLVIVGVHSPEFGWERPYESVVEATRRLGILYPVAQDNDLATWKRWSIWAWPTQVLIDRRGVVRFRHIGEGAYAETEAMIRRLLDERG